MLTLGAGREVLPHNMAVTKMYIDADDIIYTPSSYAHAIHVYLRMRGTVNWWAGWSILLVVSYRSLLRVGHRVATLLDSTQESILALRYNFWRLQGTQSCRGKPVLNLHIGSFACFHAISLERSRFSKIATLVFMPL